MKCTKRSLATLLFAFIILDSFTNCEEKKKDGDGKDKSKEEQAVDPPRQIVSLEQAKETYTNYTDRRVGLIEESEPPKPDGSKFDATRYTYYDYETVKQYMAYIEQEAKSANVEISSLRFYFSNYPDSTVFKNGNEVIHPRQNSIFLIPATIRNGLEYPFYLEEKEEGRWEAVLLTGQLDPYVGRARGMLQEGRPKEYAGFTPNTTALNLNQHEKSLILNEGSSAPPPTTSSEWSETPLPSIDVPKFPWPPPKPSAKVEVPTVAFAMSRTLDEVNSVLIEALAEKGYVDKSYFLVPGANGYGFALATQMEQIDKNAIAKAPPNRWNVHPIDNTFTFSDYISSLFFSNPGYFRVIVFIMTDIGFTISNTMADRERAMEWLDIGYSELPYFLAEIPVTPYHGLTALIYEYKVSENNKTAELVKPSKHSGKNHLEKAELWSALSGNE